MKRIILFAVVTPIVALGIISCAGETEEKSATLHGVVRVDGSSTVFPITEAVGEEFQRANPDVRVTVGVSGTGGGFKKFAPGETDINDASRPIKEMEVVKAAEHGTEFVELPVAFDGLSVVVNPENDWVDYFTIEELHRVWMPDSEVDSWNDIRPEWPDQPLRLYGPDVDSGTFDYFTETVNGKSQVCRSDYTASADDNVLVTGIAGDLNGLGYFGYAYYAENKERLKLVPIDGGAGPIAPTEETINNGTYAPLSRPLFIYVSMASGQRPEVREFIRFYLDNAPQLAAEVGYVALPQEAYDLGWQRFDTGKTGSVFNTELAKSGLSIVEVMSH